MFEVNLLPVRKGGGSSGKRGRPGKRQSRRGGRVPRLISLDLWVVGSGLIVVGSLATSVQMILGASEPLRQLDAALGEALQDSARTAERIQVWRRLEQQRDSVVARVALIEEFDARRYDWPHLLDEVAVAVPDGVRITRITDVTSGRTPIRFQIEGNARDNLSLTRFWNRLETSFFIRDVQLLSTEHLVARDLDTGDGVQASYHFVLQADSEDPPQEILDLVPFTESGT